MDVIHLFDRGAALDPERACFIVGEQMHSYREVKALSERIARKLRELGIARDHQVGVLSINDPVAFTCVLGALRAGGVWVPLNPRSTPAEHLHALNAFDVEVLFFHSLLEPVIKAVRHKLEKTRVFVCVDRESDQAPSLATWLGGVEAGPVERRIDAQARAMVAGTGGTTGAAKGVMLSHLNIETYVASHMVCAPHEAPPVHLVAAPMTHAAGVMCFPMMLRGGTNVILPTPEPQAVLQAIEKYRVTDLFLPPTVIYMLLAQPRVREFDYSSLRYFLYGAAPMSTEKLRQAIEIFGPVMTQAFGQTEAPMLCCFMSAREHFIDGHVAPDSRLTSCGRPTPFVDLALMDQDGRLVRDGERGEIVVRGNLVMLGYYRNPEASAAAGAHGWHHTGDIGYRDAEGYVHIVDRKKDMIISGGFNVYSAEVEQAVLSHPAVQDCAVIGVPDDKWGEAVKAVVQLKPGAAASAPEIVEHCKARLSGPMTPKSVEIWPDLPRSTVGKVLKTEVRNKFWAGRSRAV